MPEAAQDQQMQMLRDFHAMSQADQQKFIADPSAPAILKDFSSLPRDQQDKFFESKPQPSSPPGVLGTIDRFSKEHPVATGIAQTAGSALGLPTASPEVGVGMAKELGGEALGALKMSNPLFGLVSGAENVYEHFTGKKSKPAQLEGKVENALEPTNPKQKVGKYAAMAATTLIPSPEAGEAASAKVDRMAENFYLKRTEPVTAIMQGAKVKNSAVGFKPALEKTIGDIKSAEKDLGYPIGYGPKSNEPGHAIFDMIQATQAAKKKLWSQIEPYLKQAKDMGARIDIAPLSKAEIDNIPKMIEVRSPGQYSKAVARAKAAYQGKSLTIPEAEDLLQSFNAKLDAVYSKLPHGKRIDLATHPETAQTYAAAQKLRQLLYDKLNDTTGSPVVQQLKKQYGNLIEVEKGLWPRLNVVARQNNNTLQEQVAKWAAAGSMAKGGAKVLGAVVSGHPSLAWSAIQDFGTAIAEKKVAKLVKEANQSDTLIRRAFEKAGEYEQRTKFPVTTAPPPLPQTSPNRLLERGARQMPSIPDTSGPTGRVPYPGRGMTLPAGDKLLPEAKFEGRVTQPPVRRGGTSRLLPGATLPKTEPPPIPPRTTSVAPTRGPLPKATPTTQTGVESKIEGAVVRGGTPLSTEGRGPGSIGPGGTVPVRSTETPRRLPRAGRAAKEAKYKDFLTSIYGPRKDMVPIIDNKTGKIIEWVKKTAKPPQ